PRREGTRCLARNPAFHEVFWLSLPNCRRGARFRPPMARVTVEDCLEKEENRFALVVLAASRTRSLMKGAPQLVNVKNKPPVISLREIAAGRVRFNRASTDVVAEYIEELQRSAP